MNPKHNIKNWTEAHHLHLPDVHEWIDEINKLMHNPAFWVIIALFLIVIALIALGLLFGDSNAALPYPPTTYPWPMYP